MFLTCVIALVPNLLSQGVNLVTGFFRVARRVEQIEEQIRQDANRVQQQYRNVHDQSIGSATLIAEVRPSEIRHVKATTVENGRLNKQCGNDELDCQTDECCDEPASKKGAVHVKIRIPMKIPLGFFGNVIHQREWGQDME